MSPSLTPVRPTVQLLHELPDGSRHVDWMIAQDRQGRDPLITFRLPQRVDELDEGQQLAAKRIADHRPVYLDYEGPLSGNRGSVSRVARGIVASLHQQPDSWQLEVLWDAPHGPPRRQQLRLQRRGPSDWIIESAARTP